MNREEFLDILRQQLEGNLPPDTLYNQLSFYRDYIDREIGSGKSEESVLAALGDPRLIAKTLIDTNDIPQPKIYRKHPIDIDLGNDDTPEDDAASSDSREQEKDSEKENSHPHNDRKAFQFNLEGLPSILLTILIVVVVALLCLTVLRAFFPLLIIVVIVGIVVILLRRHRL